jgi:hypothetical protein
LQPLKLLTGELQAQPGFVRRRRVNDYRTYFPYGTAHDYVVGAYLDKPRSIGRDSSDTIEGQNTLIGGVKSDSAPFKSLRPKGNVRRQAVRIGIIIEICGKKGSRTRHP